MKRRKYIESTVGLAVASTLAGCLQGKAVLHKKRISTTSPTKEWEVELEEGNEMRLEIKKTNDMSGRIYGFVHHAETGEEIARTDNTGNGTDTFEVPTTGTYIVSVEPSRVAEGEVILRDLD